MSENTFNLGRDLTQQYEIQPGIFGPLLLELIRGWSAIGLIRLFKSGVYQSLWTVIGKRLAKRALMVILMLIPFAGYGQWLQVSPTSMPLWGQSPKVAKISLGYRSVEAVYLYGFKTLHDSGSAPFGGEYFGLFWNPLTVEKGRVKAAGGVGYFFQRYPTANGTHINFSLKLSYRISKRISIQYGHISNGFGLFNSLNPGVDNLGLVIAL